MFAYDLEHIFSYTVTLDEPEVVGPVPGGVRANLYATGGEVTALLAANIAFEFLSQIASASRRKNGG